MSYENQPDEVRLSIGKSFRHLVIFQFKLLADAVRDLILSPLSIIAFIIDAVFRPRLSKSLSLRLMMMGRYSDRIINLFNEHNKTMDKKSDEKVSKIN